MLGQSCPVNLMTVDEGDVIKCMYGQDGDATAHQEFCVYSI